MPNHITVAVAADILPVAQRIVVIGCSGGGKTTLSMKIADLFDLPYQSLDRDVGWLPGWVARDRAEQRVLLKTFAARDRWVMDGSGSSSFDVRLPRTDLVIWVRVPRRVALWGLARRVCANYGKVRVGMAKGCPEPLPDWEFLSYIWNFERLHVPQFTQAIDTHGPDVPVVTLRSHREMEALFPKAPSTI